MNGFGTMLMLALITVLGFFALGGRVGVGSTTVGGAGGGPSLTVQTGPGQASGARITSGGGPSAAPPAPASTGDGGGTLPPGFHIGPHTPIDGHQQVVPDVPLAQQPK